VSIREHPPGRAPRSCDGRPPYFKASVASQHVIGVRVLRGERGEEGGETRGERRACQGVSGERVARE